MVYSALLSTLSLVALVSSSPAPVSEIDAFSALNGGYWPKPFPRCGPFAGVSCQNTTVQNNLCCFNAPGGRFLSTQFWDYYPATGGKDVWTLHGLWPDHCDGTYDSYCDPSRELTNITAVLKNAGQDRLLKFMNEYWLNNNGTNEEFWEHEYNKHGTCISTLEPKCFSKRDGPNPDVVAYFNRAVDIYKTLPTYSFLARAGIRPTLKKTYTLAEIESALIKATGHNATVQCDKKGYFSEVWYHYTVQGSVVDGKFTHAEPDGSKSSCNSTGIKYVPKGTVPS